MEDKDAQKEKRIKRLEDQLEAEKAQLIETVAIQRQQIERMASPAMSFEKERLQEQVSQLKEKVDELHRDCVALSTAYEALKEDAEYSQARYMAERRHLDSLIHQIHDGLEEADSLKEKG